ncbi:MAG: carboxylating nicotinate-nucleotide diphosphorylase [Bryobacteraceae bacterium]
MVADLEQLGSLVRVEDYKLSVGKCQRCRTVIEPLVSKQWFVKTKPLAGPAIAVVEDGRIQMIPEHWIKTYNEWMYNIRDWCISRQLWWGHRIPAWHCPDCGGVEVAREDPASCSKCGSEKLSRDTDVLDTWFSSGLWPFSTLGWPDKTEDLAAFYPTSLLITGFDLLFFWVARMVMLGMEMVGDVPFRQVYLHGMVRDAERQKMSKTKGNVIDPIVVTEKYGTDAVRLALMMGAAPGTDISVGDERFESSRAFANKIWNASRLIFMKMETSAVEPWLSRERNCSLPQPAADALQVPLEDRWIFSRLNRCAETVNRAIEQYRFHEAAQTLWHFVWHEFCDWYLELKKHRLEEGAGLTGHWRNLLTVYEMTLRLLHPVMPFLTEELWQRLAKESADRPESIALSHYPQYNPDAIDLEAELEMSTVIDVVTKTRELRHDMNRPKHSDFVLRAPQMDSGRLKTLLPIVEQLTRGTFTVEFAEAGGYTVSGSTVFQLGRRCSKVASEQGCRDGAKKYLQPQPATWKRNFRGPRSGRHRGFNAPETGDLRIGVETSAERYAMSAWDHAEIRSLIDLAIDEDIGTGDVTTETCIAPERKASGSFYAREDVVLAGVELLPLIFEMRGGVDSLELLASSGAWVTADSVVSRLRGPAQTLLECERTALNFLQRLSGVATLARKYAEAVKGTKCRVLDTRKTTPGHRRLEKLAAAAGGVTNHRYGLYDQVLIKNNHVTAAGGVRQALEKFRDVDLLVEVEVRDRSELDEALAAGARHILLDNLTPEEAALEITYIGGRASVELSGNIDLNTVKAYAMTGADFVSSGAITHQAQSANFNFRVEME